MKTTVEISEPLFRRAKQHCSKHGISFRVLVEAGIRAAIEPPKKDATVFRLKPFGFEGEGAITNDWSTISELVYEGRGGLIPDAQDR